LVRILIPNFGNQQGHIAGANIDRAVNHSPGMTAANRNTRSPIRHNNPSEVSVHRFHRNSRTVPPLQDPASSLCLA
jgi:hypothetical protein